MEIARPIDEPRADNDGRETHSNGIPHQQLRLGLRSLVCIAGRIRRLFTNRTFAGRAEHAGCAGMNEPGEHSLFLAAGQEDFSALHVCSLIIDDGHIWSEQLTGQVEDDVNVLNCLTYHVPVGNISHNPIGASPDQVHGPRI